MAARGETTKGGMAGVSALLKQLREWTKAGRKPESIGRDGFPQFSGDLLASVHRQLDTYLRELPNPGFPNLPKSVPSGAAFLELCPAAKAKAVRAILVRVQYLSSDHAHQATVVERIMDSIQSDVRALWEKLNIPRSAAKRSTQDANLDTSAFGALFKALVSSDFPLTSEDLSWLAGLFANSDVDGVSGDLISPDIALRTVERFSEKSELSPDLRKELRAWKRRLEGERDMSGAERKIFVRLTSLLQLGEAPNLIPGVARSNVALTELKVMPGVGAMLNQIGDWTKAGKKPESVGKDGFPQFSGDPLASIHKQLDTYLDQLPMPGQFWFGTDPEEIPVGAALLKLDEDAKADVLRAILVRVALVNKNKPRESHWDVFNIMSRIAEGGSRGRNKGVFSTFEYRPLVAALLKSSPPLVAEDFVWILRLVVGFGDDAYSQFGPLELPLKSIERFAEKSQVSSDLQDALMAWKKHFGDEGSLAVPNRKIVVRIKALLGDGGAPNILAGEAWSNTALAELKEMPSDRRARWYRLLLHCQKADASKPAQKWLKAANELVEDVGRAEFKQRIQIWFELVALPRPIHREPRNPQYDPDPDLMLADANTLILKGLTWCCAGWKDPEITRAVSRLAEVCFKKIRNFGARSPRVGNACFYSLSVTTTDEAAAELSRLNQLVKQPSAKKLLGKSLDKAAELSGQTREDLEESTVPTYGLDKEGRLKKSLGDFSGEFSIVGPDAFELVWRKGDGKTQKSVPVEVKEKHAAELKTLKRTLQDIQKMLPAQRQRIERLMASEREWKFDKWRQRYLDHPLLANISRRLIWHFRVGERTASGVWHDGKIVDAQDRSLNWLSPATRVRLWHPLGQDLDVVTGWRRWFETHQVSQPFKQAHREIYVLTDAEQQTDTYSNRFAAHIIRQHQFAALAKERGWTYRLQGQFDGANTPTLVLPQLNLTVEFWVDYPAGNEATSNAGIFLNMATDQVRFCTPTGEARRLVEIPALIFSEVMRDVDLFVGVCSIGNDPAWHDHGEAGQYGVYWREFSFGELSTSAKTRHDVIERLLPKLKIAAQCSLDEKFLKVKGSLRTYKIHLGSANIMMEPNEQYLCIVPARGGVVSREEVFLPFEGDNTLAVILSKAFLLADDSKIKDQSILSQIKSR